MKIGYDALPHHLSRGLAPLYVVHGNALLLAIEAGDAIRQAARKAGYAEREVLIAGQHFRWDALHQCAQSPSLFSPRKLIDLRLPSGKPGIEGSQALIAYCAALPPDTVTLVTLPRLEGAAYKSKWFTALEQAGVSINASDIPLSELPGWIAERLGRQGQSADRDTLDFLALRAEGNLLAAWQEIQKLALLYPAGPLSFAQVSAAVADVARYDVAQLSEAMLHGNVARYAHILEGLRAEGTAPPQILWMLAEDLRHVARVTSRLQRGATLAQAMQEVRIWNLRKAAVERAVRRWPPGFVSRALRQAARIDRMIKGLCKGDLWDELLQFGLRCARAEQR